MTTKRVVEVLRRRIEYLESRAATEQGAPGIDRVKEELAALKKAMKCVDRYREELADKTPMAWGPV